MPVLKLSHLKDCFVDQFEPRPFKAVAFGHFLIGTQASRGTFQDQKPEFRASVLQKRSVSRGVCPWVFHGSSIGPTVHLVLLRFFGRYIVGGSAIEEERGHCLLGHQSLLEPFSGRLMSPPLRLQL